MAVNGSKPHNLSLDGEDIALQVHRHRRAKRLTLRIDQASGELSLVLPRRTPLAEGLAFAEGKASWIRDQLEALPPFRPFADGAVVPYLGEDQVIRHRPEARRGVWREDGAISVSGQQEHLPRRVTDYLKQEARRELSSRARNKAKTIDRKIAYIGLRDTRTRWGSCSAEGRLNFSWRLILTPETVLDYVVAHEVAHLTHMDHSRHFWSLVKKLTTEVDESRAWLQREGAALLRYG